MHETLSDILRSRYHRLYHSRTGMHCWPFSRSGFQISDGWFGLIDALSCVLVSRVADRNLDLSIRHVQEKRRTLRYSADGMDDFCLGVRAFAGMMSCRLSELSVRPGLPSRIGRYVRTLAPSEDLGATIWSEFEPTERFIAGRDPRSALALVRAAWPLTYIHVAVGHTDLVDVLMGFLTTAQVALLPPSAIIVHVTPDGMADFDDRRLGGIAVAAHLAAMRIDSLTGATGPVDDLGRPTWAAGQQRV